MVQKRVRYSFQIINCEAVFLPLKKQRVEIFKIGNRENTLKY